MKHNEIILTNQAHPRLTASTTTSAGNGTSKLYLDTGQGYLSLGPGNSTYCHMETDRGRFYFNKRLIVNEGVVSSYDEDLLLQRAESTSTPYIKITSSKVHNTGFTHIGNATATGYATDDASWGARLNVSSSVHAKIEVSQEANSMRSHWYAHTGHSSIKFGTATGHDVEFQRNGSTSLEIESGGLLTMVPIRRNSHHASGFLEGSYNNVAANAGKSNPIYTIGQSYNPSENGLSNMYGIGFTKKGNFSPLSGFRQSGWGLYVASDGDARVFLNGQTGVVASTAGYDVGNVNIITGARALQNVTIDAALITSGTIPEARIPTQAKYLRSDVADTAAGNLTFTGNITQTAGTFLSHGAQVSNLTTAWQAAGTGKDRGLYPFRFQNGATGQPEGGNNAHWGLNIYAHSGSSGNYPYGTQLSAGSSQHLWHRWFSNGGAQSWKKIWDSGNDGSGSGLDADLLDGQDGSYYLNYSNFTNTPTIPSTSSFVDLTSAQTITGTKTISNLVGGTLEFDKLVYDWTSSTKVPIIELKGATSYGWFYHEGSPDQMMFSTSGNTNYELAFSSSYITHRGNTIWHAGNDGSGSGLDAGLLQGYDWANLDKTVGARYLNIDAGNGHALRFWNGSNDYRIYMSSNGGGGAGRQAYEPNSDYNMYFRMNGGTNRGFVFQSGSSNKVGIDSLGNIRADGIISSDNKQAMNCAHWSASGTSTGAIKIALPGTTSNHSMPVIEVTTYDYSSKAHVIYTISGHNWSTTSYWYNTRVTSEGGPPLAVRLGHDGTTHCIFIGDTNTSWSYGSATVALKVHPAHYATNQNFTTGWSISQVTSIPSTTTAVTVGKIWHSTNDGSGSGLDADTLDGMNASSSVVANTIVARQGNGYIYANHVNFNTGVENPSIANFITDNGDGWSRKSSLNHVRTSLCTTNVYNNLNSNTGSGANLNTTFQNDRSGFFDCWSGSNFPPSTTHVQGIQARHQTGNDYGWQLASQYSQPGKMYLRHVSNGTFYDWYKLYTTINDGSGSGLDADLLDGLDLHTGRNNEANRVVRTDGNGYIQAGWINTTSGSTTGMDRIYASNDGYIRYVSKSTFASGISPLLKGIGSETGDPGDNMLQYWQASNNSTLNPTNDWYNAIRMGHGDPVTYYGNTIAVKMTGSGTGNLYTRTLSNGTQQSWNLHWHANNDGSGSSLDADLLDGYHGSNFIGKNGHSYYKPDTWIDFRDASGSGLYWGAGTGAGWHIHPTGTNVMRFRSGSSSTCYLELNTTGTTRGHVYANNSNEIGFLNNSGNWILKVQAAGSAYLGGTSQVRINSSSTTAIIEGLSTNMVYRASGGGGHNFQRSGGTAIAKIGNTGNFTALGNVTAYGSPSDINLKENIEVISNAVEKVQKLDGVTFNYKKDGGRSTGLIAQQLQEVLPEVVYTAEDLDGEEHLAVRYGNTVGLLVEAIKELKQEINELKAQLKEK